MRPGNCDLSATQIRELHEAEAEGRILSLSRLIAFIDIDNRNDKFRKNDLAQFGDWIMVLHNTNDQYEKHSRHDLPRKLEQSCYREHGDRRNLLRGPQFHFLRTGEIRRILARIREAAETAQPRTRGGGLWEFQGKVERRILKNGA